MRMTRRWLAIVAVVGVASGCASWRHGQAESSGEPMDALGKPLPVKKVTPDLAADVCCKTAEQLAEKFRGHEIPHLDTAGQFMKMTIVNIRRIERVAELFREKGLSGTRDADDDEDVRLGLFKGFHLLTV